MGGTSLSHWLDEGGRAGALSCHSKLARSRLLVSSPLDKIIHTKQQTQAHQATRSRQTRTRANPNVPAHLDNRQTPNTQTVGRR